MLPAPARPARSLCRAGSVRTVRVLGLSRDCARGSVASAREAGPVAGGAGSAAEAGAEAGVATEGDAGEVGALASDGGTAPAGVAVAEAAGVASAAAEGSIASATMSAAASAMARHVGASRARSPEPSAPVVVSERCQRSPRRDTRPSACSARGAADDVDRKMRPTSAATSAPVGHPAGADHVRCSPGMAEATSARAVDPMHRKAMHARKRGSRMPTEQG